MISFNRLAYHYFFHANSSFCLGAREDLSSCALPSESPSLNLTKSDGPRFHQWITCVIYREISKYRATRNEYS